MPAITFFEEGISYKLKNKTAVRKWITDTIIAEGFKLNELNYIFAQTNTCCK
jgi:probable rRNA maturation factor